MQFPGLTKISGLNWELSEQEPYYHVNCHIPNLSAGSGFAQDVHLAKAKAFSEMVERYMVSELASDPKAAHSWRLDFDPSCSGFAVGFNKDRTLWRSICEATERFVVSKWIDEDLPLSRLRTTPHQHIALGFKPTGIEEWYGFYVELPVQLGDRVVILNSAVMSATTKRGIFCGYATRLDLDEAIEHAIVEAMRNLSIFRNQAARDFFPFDRIWYFGENKEFGLRKILKNSTFEKSRWPTPLIKFSRADRFEDIWLARTIFDGWTPWQLGPIDRFIC